LVSAGSGDKKAIGKAKVIKSYPVFSSSFLQIPLVFFILGWLLLSCPNRFLSFFRLQKESGRSTWDALKSIYINGHILPFNLDWIHFGFATMGIGREYLAKALDAKMAVSIRGFDIAIFPLKHPGCYDLLWKNVDKVHVISDDLEQKLRKTRFPESKFIQKITPAIAFERFYYQRKHFHIDRGRPVRILSVGRLHWKKGYEYALQAMSQLKALNIPFVFSIVGTGSDLERLKFAVYQLNIEKEVVFKGKLNHDEVAKEMKEADIYLQPSIQEGFCNAVLEAQAAGCFCVVSDAEGLSENVLDGITGRVFKRRDVNAMLEIIREVIGFSAEARASVVLTAQKRVQNNFSIDEQIRKFEHFYED
jgi:colanic acid/amylovoran biosynthesis glycosyltransferase